MSDKYEWLGDANPNTDEGKEKIANKLMGTDHSVSYKEPDRVYDTTIDATDEYVDSLPDLQNGPESLIKGAPVEIQQVGIYNFRLPVKYLQRPDKGDKPIKLETSVTGTVSLEGTKKGINMSRILRTFYDSKDEVFSLDFLPKVLQDYRNKLGSFDARVVQKISYPIIQESLRSGMFGYQYYEVAFESTMNKNGVLSKYIHFDFVYSSACPCSFELAEHARKYRNKATVSHSQRSVARITVKIKDDGFVWIEDLQEMALEALKTETQVMVKRQDEQAFAELNGSYTKFVEDATRLLYDVLSKNENVEDFKVVCSHLESLHSHDAIGVIVKGVPGGFRAEVDPWTFQTMVK